MQYTNIHPFLPQGHITVISSRRCPTLFAHESALRMMTTQLNEKLRTHHFYAVSMGEFGALTTHTWCSTLRCDLACVKRFSARGAELAKTVFTVAGISNVVACKSSRNDTWWRERQLEGSWRGEIYWRQQGWIGHDVDTSMAPLHACIFHIFNGLSDPIFTSVPHPTHHQAVSQMAINPAFSAALSAAIGTSGADVFWECCSCSGATAASTPFEFVVLDASRGFKFQRASATAFAQHLDLAARAGDTVACFDNLDRSARLLAPVKNDIEVDICLNIGRFMAKAPVVKRRALWMAIAQEVTLWWSQTPHKRVWVSTSGLGVPWLHVRLDARPKYYQFQGYK